MLASLDRELSALLKRNREAADAGYQDNASLLSKVKCGRSRRGRGRLKAFSGPFARQRAALAGYFIAATIFKDSDAKRRCDEYGIDHSFHALKETGNDTGGFLVPEELEDAVIDLRDQYGAFAQNANVVSMGS